MRARIFAAMLMLAAAFICRSAAAQNYWPTPGGSNINGALDTCLNSSGQAVPWWSPAGVWQCAGTLPSGGSVTQGTTPWIVAPATADNPWPTGGSYFYNVASSVLTRVANTTQYTANTTVCAAASVTACAPITIAIASTNAGKGLINRVSLLKSGSATTSADFIIWFFSAAPGVATPAQYDDVAYAGPRAADMPNYIGNATCAVPTATSDTTAGVWYECTLSNPNTAGALVFQALSGVTTIDALISVTATYVPASAETWTVYVSGIY